jgi:hypothetical protein
MISNNVQTWQSGRNNVGSTIVAFKVFVDDCVIIVELCDVLRSTCFSS